MRKNSNAMLAGGLAAVLFGMLGLSFAAVPLYRLFCQVTGFGGTPMIGGPAAPGATGHAVTVRFNADTHRNLPWRFAPEQVQVQVKMGEDSLAFYVARNRAPVPVTGTALYNVTPEKVGRYFHKTACFCFDEQTLQPGQEMQFPVSFWIDPAMATDPDTRDVKNITLSYTFFRKLDDAAPGAADTAGPHVGPRAEAVPPSPVKAAEAVGVGAGAAVNAP